MLGAIKKIRCPGIISIAVSNWNFLCDKIITVGSVGEAVKKNEGFKALKSILRNKNEKHKQNRGLVVVDKKEI
ncbi:MAG: hypothetical protein ACI93P_000265 [bacterium]